MTDTDTKSTPIAVRLIIAAYSLVAVLVLVQKIITKGLNHDEHQFVAPSALLLRDGLWPYIHYPHFHMPNLVFLNALPLMVCDHALLGMRLLTALLAWVLLMLIFGATWRAFTPLRPLVRAVAAMTIVTLTVANSTYLYTAGIAWNHQHAALCAVAAFLLLVRASRQAGPTAVVFAAGVLLAVGIGIRLSIAPLGLPLLLMIVLAPARREQRTARLVMAYFAGLVVGMLPSIALFVAAPSDFWFDNLGYPALNRAYWAATDPTAVASIVEKLKQVYYTVLRRPMDMPGLGVFVGAIAISGAWRVRSSARYAFEARAAVMCLPFVMIGSFAPTPWQPQYLFVVVPFVSLAAMYAMASVCTGGRAVVWPIPVAVAASVCAVALGARHFTIPDNALRPERWSPARVHRAGEQITTHVRAGRVVTLEPIFVIETGEALTIDPRLSAGPFAWRTAYLLTPEQRRARKMIGPDDFAAAYESQRPRAILIAEGSALAESLEIYATQHKFTSHELGDGMWLWVHPN